jgi:glycerol-3-phosphate acyltransferase PlsY
MYLTGTILIIFCSYLIGSFPTAYVFVRLFKRLDIREYGSGNVGATNAARVIGKKLALIVLALDFLKGTAAVTLLPIFFGKLFLKTGGFENIVYILAGAAVISGHIWTIFLKFKGGKGVATTAGVMAGLSPEILLSGLLLWLIIFFIWRYVSLASISAAIALPVLSLVFGKDLDFIIFVSIVCFVGVYSHRSNIRRLIQRNESKLR